MNDYTLKSVVYVEDLRYTVIYKCKKRFDNLILKIFLIKLALLDTAINFQYP